MLAAVVAATAAWAAPHFYVFQLKLRAGQYRVALQEIRKELQNNPDDVDLHAYAGIAAERAGMYGDSAAEFEISQGSAIYEKSGVSSHAETLRVTGEPQAAAALRASQLVMVEDEDEQAIIWMGLVDDYRAAGDYAAAYDAAWQALSISPNSGLIYAFLGDLLMDMGDLEAARYAVWNAERLGGKNIRIHIVKARLSLLDGELDEAYDELIMKKLLRRNHILGAMQAEVLRRQGFPDAALSLLNSPRFPDRERPYMMAEMMACYAEIGDMENARSLRRRGLSLFPTDANILAAVSVVDKVEAAAAAKVQE